MNFATPFAGATPTAFLYVSLDGSDAGTGAKNAPLRTIQAAVSKATPGTAIVVGPGTFTENVKLPSTGGRPDAPIWLVPRDGQGTTTIVAADDALPVIKGLGTDNFVIRDFQIEGGYHGIQFSQSGRNFTNTVSNVVIEGNTILGAARDGIKISQAENIHVLDNVIVGGAEEGIDFVAVNNSVIARNDVSQIMGSAGIFAKGGSSGILMKGNHVHDVAKDGIVLGGWSTADAFRPGTLGYEAKNVTIVGNRVEDVGKRPLNVLGGQDSQIYGNFFEATPGYYTAVHIGYGSPHFTPRPVSKNLDIHDNVFTRSTALLSIEHGNSAGVTFHHNATDGIWSQPVGPDGNASGWVSTSSGVLSFAEGPALGLAADAFATTATLEGRIKTKITGGSGDDHIRGTDLNDYIDGGGSDDVMVGLGGDDTYIVNVAEDRLIEFADEGIDVAHVYATRFVLPDHVENLIAKTRSGVAIEGNGLDNMMRGTAFADRIAGGEGADVLTGGAGADVFIFRSVADGGDTITDFVVGEDQLDLTALLATNPGLDIRAEQRGDDLAIFVDDGAQAMAVALLKGVGAGADLGLIL